MPPVLGEHIILATGKVDEAKFAWEVKLCSRVGNCFDTKEKAEKARDIMVKHGIILKYVIDHAPDFEPTEFECHSVYLDKEENLWYSVSVELETEVGTVLMPEWVAEKLADDLNNNRIEGV